MRAPTSETRADLAPNCIKLPARAWRVPTRTWRGTVGSSAVRLGSQLSLGSGPAPRWNQAEPFGVTEAGPWLTQGSLKSYPPSCPKCFQPAEEREGCRLGVQLTSLSSARS